MNEYVSQIRGICLLVGACYLCLIQGRVQPRLMCAYDILAEILRRSGDVFSSRPTISVYAKIKLAFKTWVRNNSFSSLDEPKNAYSYTHF